MLVGDGPAASFDNGIPVLSPYEELVRESGAPTSIAVRQYNTAGALPVSRGRGAGAEVTRLLDGRMGPGYF